MLCNVRCQRKLIMRIRIASCLLLALVVLGCGGKKFAPVSGVVTLDGKPYGMAAISFQPIGDKDNPNPGRGSNAFTDENGRFVLKSDGTEDGAIVGKHLVRISTRPDAKFVDAPSPDGGGPPTPPDRIPVEWRVPGKEFTVPPGGTDKANFDIVTK